MKQAQLLGLATAALILCGFIPPSPDDGPFDIRYKETLTFSRSGEPFSVSGVDEMTLSVCRYISAGTGACGYPASRQAIPIDLGPAGLLFALDSYPYSNGDQRTMLLLAACNLPEVERSGDVYLLRGLVRAIVDLDRPCTVPRSSWPILVRFRDMTDPTTIERVLPEELPELTGGMISLEAVTVEKTDDPASKGIEKILPWVDMPGFPLKGIPIRTVEKHPRENPLAVFRYDFKIEQAAP